MTDAISVLLLIGSAVVGPVEAQPTGPKAVEHARGLVMSRCIKREMDEGRAQHATQAFDKCGIRESGGYNLMDLKLESLDQLCDRAMKEMRAYAVYGLRDQTIWYLPKNKGAPDLTPDNLVRCIPTPKGYRK